MCSVQSSPKESHLTCAKNILKYVKGTIEFGLWYTNDSSCEVIGYSDADWGGSTDDFRSTSGGCYYLGQNLVGWSSKKQTSVTLSTAESEYVAAGACCAQLIWIKQMLSNYGIIQSKVHLYCDNESAICIAKNPGQHSRTKHINIRHHFIRELVESKELVIVHISTDNQLADLFTKPLDKPRFERLRHMIGMTVIDN